MINIADVKERYATMSDTDILRLADESSSLTHEAFLVLKQEFKKRTLDNTIISYQQQIRIEQKKQVVRDNITQSRQDFAGNILELVLNAKYNNHSDKEICEQLVEQGISQEQTLKILEQLEAIVGKMKESNQNDIIAGAILFIVGVIVSVATFNASINGRIGVVAWGAILVGAIKIVNGENNKSRLKVIGNNVQLNPCKKE